jgi:TetR/AcrR family transcriptional repressor of nem operon
MARRRDITREEILDAAQRLIQTRGANGYAVRDLAAEIGFSAASLHHHFPSRAELLTAVFRRYRERLNARLAEIEAETDTFFTRLERLVSHFAAVSGDENRLCLASVAAVELPTLPPVARDETFTLWANLTGWITRFTLRGKTDGELPAETDAELLALQFTATLQGALLLQRTAPPGTHRRILHAAVDALRRLTP